MEWFAIFVIGLMLLQHWDIQRRIEDPGNWEKTLLYYRRIIRLAFGLSFIFFVVITVVFVLDLFMDREVGIIHRTENFIEGDGPISVLAMAFFVGIARLFAERALEARENLFSGFKEFMQSFFASEALKRESSIGSLSGIGNGPRHDAWFFWLCFSLIISILDALLSAGGSNSSGGTGGNATSNTAGATVAWFFAGVGASLYLALGYFLWIYMTLYLKLVQHHHFTGRAARLFLGRIGGDQLPRQCTIIGPSLSGKTVFARQGGTAVQGDTKQSPHVDETTTKVDIRTAPTTSDEGITLNVTTLDTPGENLGDHILLASTFRSDVLILVLDLGMLDSNAMTDTDNFSLANWHRLIRQDLDAEAVRRAVNYMQGFHLATTRSIGKDFISPSELFKVRAFTLFLNRKNPRVLKELRQSLDRNNEQLQELAREIGVRLGVKEQECCCIAGNAKTPVEAFHLIATSTRGRLVRSFWPRRLDDVKS